jgi:hypothetical protein
VLTLFMADELTLPSKSQERMPELRGFRSSGAIIASVPALLRGKLSDNIGDKWLECRNTCTNDDKIHLNSGPVCRKSAVKHSVLTIAGKDR